MTFSIHGLAVARGIAIGRAVLVASSRVDVAHYFVQPEQVNSEIQRLRVARDAVVDELQRLQKDMPKDAPHELAALLDVHLMLLQDEELTSGVVHWIKTRLYNAEWALTSQLDIIVRQFEEMEDPYLRERKADMEQVGERVLHCLKGTGSMVAQAKRPQRPQQELQLGDTDVPLVLVAHDLSPADMLQFKQSVFTGFVTDVGGKTSHTAIVAPQSGHSGRGGRTHRQPAGQARRLGHHRRRCGGDHRRPFAHHHGRLRLQAAPGRPRARAPGPFAAHTIGHPGWAKDRAVGQH